MGKVLMSGRMTEVNVIFVVAAIVVRVAAAAGGLVVYSSTMAKNR